MKSRSAQNIVISDIADKGYCIGKDEDGRVFLTRDGVPGDVVDLFVKRKKKGLFEAEITRYHTRSPHRVEPFCRHFGECGGCKWQYMDYAAQLQYKELSVRNALMRIGRFENPLVKPILGAKKTRNYRNKLEFSFSSNKWITKDEIESGVKVMKTGAVGFHPSGFFDKVVDIQACHLQPSPSNEIRNALREYAINRQLSFYDSRIHSGLLRSLIIRNTSLGEQMVILVFGEDDNKRIAGVLNFIIEKFPQVASLFYSINLKKNDSISDLKMSLFYGRPYITEHIEQISFRIGPKSFFQTNTTQAELLYKVVKEYAQLNESETLFDLYSGTGSIGLFLASSCQRVFGIEEIPMAVEDAKLNARNNQIENAEFIVGDVKEKFEVLKKNCMPDVVVVDPPRAGLHPLIIDALLDSGASRIIYVSCNPATQARDLSLLSGSYQLVSSQPVDMFPHTHHIENVAYLRSS